MTEREELELAAKAGGIDGEWVEAEPTSHGGFWVEEHLCYWRPKTRDDHSLQLGVKIGAFNGWPEFNTYRTAYELEGHDALTATKLAIFRLAVEIGGKL